MKSRSAATRCKRKHRGGASRDGAACTGAPRPPLRSATPIAARPRSSRRPPACSPSAAITAPPPRTSPTCCGIRQASLYYYFPSKEAALELVCIQGVDGFFETAQAIAGGPGNAAREAGRADPGASRAHSRPRRFRAGLPHERQYLPDAAAGGSANGRAGSRRSSRTSFATACAGGEFRADLDPRLTTLAILGMATALSTGTARKTPRSSGSAANSFARWCSTALGRPTIVGSF